MQIVIDIPEDLYEGIERRDGALETEYVCYELMKAVDNGVSLPKGHGRLIDESDLMPDSDYEDGVFYAVSAGQIAGLPTIVAADKTESGGDVLDKIKGYVDHIRNTGMGKKKSLEFIEKFIEGLKAESEE